ncbi:DNA recombination protein RmuC [Propioniciclava tarda]|uniref:DNA recombination protein RmuC n=1 Tax=Propioniciclava tarda TaxID=433330 RepID=UPI00116A802E|nr:DNA recombination protein RmuC [Propioniciclava tarda]SMO70502.1 DNA recombination protein RmuC [Propioniciclava tarda]
MDMILTLAIGLVIGIALGAAAAWVVGRARADSSVARESSLRAQLDAARHDRDQARARADEIAEAREAMVNEFKVLARETAEAQARRSDEGAEIRHRATDQLLAPVRQGLDQLNARLADVERLRSGQAADLSAQVQAVKATGEALRRETASLATALRKPQVRGAWGELQLRRVAELAGMLDHVDFVTQQTATSDDRAIRPDMKVLLSGGRFVYVDSKVPLAAFLDGHDRDDERERAESLAAFGRNVRTHVDQLSSKHYFRASPSTPEFVVLFIPSEALAAEAAAQLPDLHEYAAGKNVVIATPTTLIALLRAVAYGWRQAALAESTAEVFALGRELYDRLATLGSHFDKLGRSLNGAVRAYNVALGSLESRVLVSGRRLRDLQLTDADLIAPTGVEEVARPVTAPELAADAEERVPRLPEAEELVRQQPALDELLDEEGGERLAGWREHEREAG